MVTTTTTPTRRLVVIIRPEKRKDIARNFSVKRKFLKYKWRWPLEIFIAALGLGFLAVFGVLVGF
jgi:hypothetical protein